MKRSLVLPIGVTVAITLLSSVGLHKAEEVAAKNAAVIPAPLRWYYVDQDDGVDLAGQSKLEPQQIADSLKEGEYLRLENIRTLDATGKWSSNQGKNLTGTIFVRPNLVRTFQPLVGDPLEEKSQ